MEKRLFAILLLFINNWKSLSERSISGWAVGSISSRGGVILLGQGTPAHKTAGNRAKLGRVSTCLRKEAPLGPVLARSLGEVIVPWGRGYFPEPEIMIFFFNLVYTVVVRSLLDHEDSSTSPKYLSPLCPSGYFACYVIVHASMRFKTLANFRYVFAAWFGKKLLLTFR